MISNSDRVIAVELIDEARANGARLKPACNVLNISDRTYQRWTKESSVKKDQRPIVKRPAPKNKLTEEEMNTHRAKSKPPVKREPPTHIAKAPNEVWTWDITWLNASIKGQPLVLHSDNGSPMKAATFLATLEKLGVQSSFSRPRVSNDNPYSESLFKTMKYRPQYPFKGFSSLDEARQWVSKFVKWYNYTHLHSGINFITPYQRHYGLGESIMENRIKVYETAKAKNPSRWSRNIRNWTFAEYVALNPIKESELKDIRYVQLE